MESELSHPLATFRPTLRPICRLVFGLFVGVSAIGAAGNFMKGRSLWFTARGLLAAAVVFAGLVALLAALVWPLRVTIYNGGIRGRTKWGSTAFIPWSDVSELRTHNASGMLFVIVKAHSGGPEIWTLPDVLAGPEFQRLVSGLAGSANPILLANSLGG